VVGNPTYDIALAVILDEPTAGLDPELRLRFREIVSRIGDRRTVVLSTHQTEADKRPRGGAGWPGSQRLSVPGDP
jgi:ABC-type molybdenum transport system ATPase subunit/photorepair protein PhrA